MKHDSAQPGHNGRASSAVDWEAELAAHRTWLRTVIAARVGERQAVDDVFQEVAGAAVEQRSPITDHAKVAPWLYRLAVVHALRYRRRMGQRRRHERKYAHAYSRTGAHNEDIPINWLLLKERREMVQAPLTRLRGRDAEILMLKYYENWSYRQLSDRLGISERAVDARLHRARQRLRAELGSLANEE